MHVLHSMWIVMTNVIWLLEIILIIKQINAHRKILLNIYIMV